MTIFYPTEMVTGLAIRAIIFESDFRILQNPGLHVEKYQYGIISVYENDQL